MNVCFVTFEVLLIYTLESLFINVFPFQLVFANNEVRVLLRATCLLKERHTALSVVSFARTLPGAFVQFMWSDYKERVLVARGITALHEVPFHFPRIRPKVIF
uniref:Putative secreted protein n=1 Tax=Rhipicephalus microplus TaxID=6941 RepID=A0A6M2DCZ9_RHIMP